jgi:hypothetical protein
VGADFLGCALEWGTGARDGCAMGPGRRIARMGLTAWRPSLMGLVLRGPAFHRETLVRREDGGVRFAAVLGACVQWSGCPGAIVGAS